MDNDKGIEYQIAENLKKHRKDKNISQMKLAELADIHFTYYSQIERALRKDISVRVLKKIADALSITLNDLVA